MNPFDVPAWIGIIGLFVTGISYAVASTVYVTRIELRCHDMVGVAKELIIAILERELVKEQKSRHDLSNHIQVQIDSIERDYRSLADRMSTMVHKDDLLAVEMRIMAAIDKLDGRLELMKMPGQRA